MSTPARDGAGRGVDAGAIVEALRAGPTFVSASPGGPQLYLDDEQGGSVEVSVRGGEGAALLVIGDGRVLEAAAVAPTRDEEWARTISLPARTSYVRAQLVDTRGDVLALTSALWLDAG